jgi:hypothetical protein
MCKFNPQSPKKNKKIIKKKKKSKKGKMYPPNLLGEIYRPAKSKRETSRTGPLPNV